MRLEHFVYTIDKYFSRAYRLMVLLWQVVNPGVTEDATVRLCCGQAEPPNFQQMLQLL
jgi:hypothetical protein